MNLFSFPRRYLALALGLALQGPVAAADARTGAAIVPDDFGSLMDGDTEYIDVQVLGQRLGMFPVTVRPDTLTFDNPDAVIDALLGAGAVLDDDARATLSGLLATRLSTHEALACSVATGPCGYLATDSADVILDRQKAALSLFLRSDWFARKPPDERFHTPTEGAENALVHRQTAFYASSRQFSSLAVNGVGALGVTDAGYIGFDWRLIRQASPRHTRTDVTLRSVYGRQDIGKTHYVQAGRMDMRNLSSPLGGNFGIAMQPFSRMEGVRIGTTQAYVNREVAGRGTPVTVILTQPARVDAYRGEELLGSTYLPAGLQDVDTSTFPVGSYPVTLRIVQNGAAVRDETVPFVREGGSLGRGGEGVQWFAQAGHALYDSVDDGSRGRSRLPAAQAGVRLPLFRGVALGNSLARIDGRLYDETRIDAWVPVGGRSLNLSISQLVGSDGARGQMQQLTFGRRISWSLYRYRTLTRHCNDADQMRMRGLSCTSSLSATVSAPLGSGQLTLGYARSSSRRRWETDPFERPLPALPGHASMTDSTTASRALSLGYSRVFSVGPESLASLGASSYRRRLTGGRSDTGGFLSVTFTRLPPQNAGLYSRVQSLGAQAATPRNGAATKTLRASETRTWKEHGYRQLSAEASGDDRHRFNATVNGRYEGSAGRLTAYLSHDRIREGGGTFSSSAGYTSAFALSRHGFVMGSDAGGSDPGAGVAVSVAKQPGASDRAAASIVSSTSSPMLVRSGHKRLVTMDAFTRNTLDAKDVATGGGDASVRSILETGTGPRQWFLTPGKVGRESIASRLSLTYLGRIALPDTTTAQSFRLLNAVSADVDPSGAFVAEFDHEPSSLYVWRQGMVYVCRATRSVTKGSIRRMGVVPCEVTSMSALPETVRRRVPDVSVASRGVGVRKVDGPEEVL